MTLAFFSDFPDFSRISLIFHKEGWYKRFGHPHTSRITRASYQGTTQLPPLNSHRTYQLSEGSRVEYGGYVRRERHAREEEHDVRIVDPSLDEWVLSLLRI